MRYSAEQLQAQLLQLPTQALDAAALNRVIYSVLHHHQQSCQLYQGYYQQQPHHWLIWLHPLQPLRVDYRRVDLPNIDAGIRAVEIDAERYHNGQPYQQQALPLLLLPSFCQQQFAHFDHLN
ncbi:hypothetical protein [Ferrimonas senticii]|uniref:hypothetical protein n=1 Tax=Ferrimonas senticii TaxID=394566 RepID=UPI0004147683|nr:hypothetical protein [Ferrimonas senticii]